MDIKVDSNSVVVFDLDDTLYNELDYLRSAYTQIAEKLQPDSWEALFLKMFSQYRSQKNVFEIVSSQYQVPIPELLELYRNHHPDLKPFTGVIELLDRIKKKEGKIAIITDGRTSTQNRKIEALGIKSQIDKIVISEEIGTEKPSEQNFLAIENAFSRKSHIYIADNCKKDFIAPNKLGWDTICLVDNGKNIHKENYLYHTPDLRPKHYILSLENLNVV